MRELLQVTENLMNELRSKGPTVRLPGPFPVLVVEDNPHDMELMRLSLGSQGFMVYCAADGCKAVELIQSNPSKFKIIFLDLNLPGLDGVDVFKRIRNLAPDTHIIIVTGTNRINELPKDGYFGVVQKPLTPVVINEIVSKTSATGAR